MEVETVTTAPQTTQTAPLNPQAKHWAGCTLNNYTDIDIAKFAVIIQPMADYYVFGKEKAPTTGTPHLQFMVCFKTAKRLTALMKILKAMWFVKSARSTMQEASDYCKKVGVLNCILDIYLYINSYRMVILLNGELYLLTKKLLDLK